MARKRRGLAFLLLGVLLLLTAGGWYAYNLLEDATAGERAAGFLKQLEEIPPTDGEAAVIVDGEAFCGRIIIDRLKVALPVYDGWDYARLKTAPCRYTGAAATNDLIIAAHNYRSHFGALDTLQEGDAVRFVDAGGTEHRYAVRRVISLDGTAVSDMQAGGWDLTLFTCTKSGKQRVTVRCERQ